MKQAVHAPAAPGAAAATKQQHRQDLVMPAGESIAQTESRSNPQRRLLAAAPVDDANGAFVSQDTHTPAVADAATEAVEPMTVLSPQPLVRRPSSLPVAAALGLGLGRAETGLSQSAVGAATNPLQPGDGEDERPPMPPPLPTMSAGVAMPDNPREQKQTELASVSIGSEGKQHASKRKMVQPPTTADALGAFRAPEVRRCILTCFARILFPLMLQRDWGPLGKYVACNVVRDKCMVHNTARECIDDELCGVRLHFKNCVMLSAMYNCFQWCELASPYTAPGSGMRTTGFCADRLAGSYWPEPVSTRAT